MKRLNPTSPANGSSPRIYPDGQIATVAPGGIAVYRACKALALACLLFLESGGPAFADVVGMESWGPEKSPYTFAEFDCVKNNIDTLVINGTIEFKHPEDAFDRDSAPEMILTCNNIIFADKSLVKTRAALRITAEKVMSGKPTIVSDRARPGANGVIDPNIYAVRIRPDKPAAPDGTNGDNASDDLFNGRGSGAGGRGADGSRGDDGEKGEDGNDGRPAMRAARVLFYARTYGAGTVVNLTSSGADGGEGQRGGLGMMAGGGGRGGGGGKGGNSTFLKSASRGGDGGDGGNGGTGGIGGTGGKGGDASDGGDLFVIVIVSDPERPGNPPAQRIWSNEGGKGGEPGIGGTGGGGGSGGPRGQAGCGGSPAKIGDWQLQPGARCGGQGKDGRKGDDGYTGLTGRWGRDGRRGEQGTNKIGYIKDPALAGVVDFSRSRVAYLDDPAVSDASFPSLRLVSQSPAAPGSAQ